MISPCGQLGSRFPVDCRYRTLESRRFLGRRTKRTDRLRMPISEPTWMPTSHPKSSNDYGNFLSFGKSTNCHRKRFIELSNLLCSQLRDRKAFFCTNKLPAEIGRAPRAWHHCSSNGLSAPVIPTTFNALLRLAVERRPMCL